MCYKKPKNSDFGGGDENMTHYPTNMQERLSSTSFLEFKIVYICRITQGNDKNVQNMCDNTTFYYITCEKCPYN